MAESRPFVHLHGHTIFSLQDALADPLELARKAQALGMTALAATDHRVGYGLLNFYQACRGVGIKPLLGAELNECDRRDVTSPKERKAQGIGSYHLPVLALDFTGYQHLCRILTEAATNGLFHGYGSVREETDLKVVRENGWGKRLIALTGCIGGRLAHLLLHQNDMAAAAAWLQTLQETFEEVYLELQFHSLPEQQVLNLAILELHRETGVPLVATRDYHYVLPEDGPVRSVYITTARGWGGKGDSSDNPVSDCYDYYLASPEEMYGWVDAHPDYLQKCQALGIDPYSPLANTQVIADRIEIELPMGKSLMPSFPVPAPHTEKTYLRKLCIESLAKYARQQAAQGTPIHLPTYIERLEWELQVICDRGNAGYMLMVWDILRHCREAGIITGPGRGSGAGSLVNFLLHITRLDPIPLGLLFQRFLSPDREDEPDIDTDVSDADRSRLIAYVAERWGTDRVAQIGNHIGLGVKSATQDLGKALGLKNDEVVALTKPLPSNITFDRLREVVKDDPDMEILGDMDPDEIESLKDAAQQYWDAVDRIPGLGAAIKRVTGALKSVGIHAGGVAISPVPLVDLMPLTAVPDKAVINVTQFNMDNLHDLGVVKVDLLAVKTLSVIHRCLELIRTTTGETIDLDHLPLDDAEAFVQYYRHPHGLFQAGRALQKVARDLRPSTFSDIVALVALSRPGPLDAEVEPGVTIVDRFIENKSKLAMGEPIAYPHPDLADVLADSYGCFIYQESVMLSAGILAGFTPGAQDTLRKGIAKKVPETVEALRYVFLHGSAKAAELISARIAEMEQDGKTGLDTIKKWQKALADVQHMGNQVPGGLAKGYSLELLNGIYDQWVAFGNYAFNKSHSAAYGLVSYWTAYLKAHYPVQFMAALLSIEADKPDKTKENLREVRRLGIPLLPPDVTRSDAGFSVTQLENGQFGIVYGLRGIKGIGTKAVDEILTQRRIGGGYTSLEDFFQKVDSRVLNRGVVATLIKAGAFDCFNPNRYEVWNWYHFVYRKLTKADREKVEQYDPSEWQPEVGWSWEKELIGQYVSGHPLDHLPNVVWEQVAHRQEVEIGGELVSLKEKTDKRGRKMASGKIETASGLQIPIVVFADVWEKCHDQFVAGGVVILRGRKDASRSWEQLIVNRVSKSTRRKAVKPKPVEGGLTAAPWVVTEDPLQEVFAIN